jgi:hypothetical protein
MFTRRREQAMGGRFITTQGTQDEEISGIGCAGNAGKRAARRAKSIPDPAAVGGSKGLGRTDKRQTTGSWMPALCFHGRGKAALMSLTRPGVLDHGPREGPEITNPGRRETAGA